MSEQPRLECFVEQVGTPRILQYVSRYCAECYREFQEGEKLYYDTQSYRYLCRECAERFAERLDEACEVVDEDQQGGLF